MRVAIIGAGAMGGLLGFYLADNAEVLLVDGWAEHVTAINTGGLHCEVHGVEQVRPAQAVSDPAQAAPVDVALVLVKAHQTAWAAGCAAALLGPEGVAYTLQNGVGNRELLAATLGAARAGQGVTALGATLLGPGRVRHAGIGATHFGLAPQPQLATALADLFQRCGLPAEVSAEIDALVWGKLLVNVGINALSALLRVPNGALADLPQARTLLTDAVREAATVAAARGIQLPYADPVAHALAVARATAANRSSMLQDVLRGGHSEVGTINGAIVREGRRLGVPTPINSMLLALVQALEESAAWRVG
ncbi:MAG: 2-dehydropantoate 2-reductase [Oscillochloris sp.]|nr:2-dehydropantoate 2-reductase [Oscillochloris sp.]